MVKIDDKLCLTLTIKINVTIVSQQQQDSSIQRIISDMMAKYSRQRRFCQRRNMMTMTHKVIGCWCWCNTTWTVTTTRRTSRSGGWSWSGSAMYNNTECNGFQSATGDVLSDVLCQIRQISTNHLYNYNSSRIFVFLIMDYLHLCTSMHLLTLLLNHYYCSLHCLHCTVIQLFGYLHSRKCAK